MDVAAEYPGEQGRGDPLQNLGTEVAEHKAGHRFVRVRGLRAEPRRLLEFSRMLELSRVGRPGFAAEQR